MSMCRLSSDFPFLSFSYRLISLAFALRQCKPSVRLAITGYSFSVEQDCCGWKKSEAISFLLWCYFFLKNRCIWLVDRLFFFKKITLAWRKPSQRVQTFDHSPWVEALSVWVLRQRQFGQRCKGRRSVDLWLSGSRKTPRGQWTRRVKAVAMFSSGGLRVFRLVFEAHYELFRVAVMKLF